MELSGVLGGQVQNTLGGGGSIRLQGAVVFLVRQLTHGWKFSGDLCPR